MLRTTTAILGLLWGLCAASAADMPVKAPNKVSNPFISYTGSGWYWFGGAFGGQTTIDTTSGVRNGTISASGAGVSAGGGFMWGRGTTWIAVDARANYATTGGSELCGVGTLCSFQQHVSIEGRAKYGSDSSALTNWLPNLGLSGLFDVLPQVGPVAPSHPYLFAYGEVGRNHVDIAALDQTKWRTEFGGGVGMVHQMGVNRALDTWVKCGFAPAGNTAIGVSSLKIGSTCKGGMDIIF